MMYFALETICDYYLHSIYNIYSQSATLKVSMLESRGSPESTLLLLAIKLTVTGFFYTLDEGTENSN